MKMQCFIPRQAALLTFLVVVCFTECAFAGFLDKLKGKGKGRADIPPPPPRQRVSNLSQTPVQQRVTKFSQTPVVYPDEKKQPRDDDMPPAYSESSAAGSSRILPEYVWDFNSGPTDTRENELERAELIQALFNKYRSEVNSRSAMQKIIPFIREFGIDIIIDDTATMMMKDGYAFGTRWGTLTKMMAQLFPFLNQAKGDTMRIHPLSQVVVEDIKFEPGLTTHMSPDAHEAEHTMIDFLSIRPDEYVSHIAATLDATRDVIKNEQASTPRLIYMFVDGGDSNRQRGRDYFISVVRELRDLSERYDTHIGLQIVSLGNEAGVEEFYDRIDTDYDGRKFFVDYVNGSECMQAGMLNPEMIYKIIMGPIKRSADRLHEN